MPPAASMRRDATPTIRGLADDRVGGLRGAAAGRAGCREQGAHRVPRDPPALELLGASLHSGLHSGRAEELAPASALRGQAHAFRSCLAALGGPLGPRLAALDSVGAAELRVVPAHGAV